MFEKMGVLTTNNVPKSLLAGIDAPLLSCSKNSLNSTEQKYDVNGVFIPFCLFQESFKQTPFSSIDLHMIIYTANAVHSTGQNSDNKKGLKNDVPSTCQAIVKLVNHSNVHQKHSSRDVVRF